MKRAGIIGLGDMGSGLAKNLIKNDFETIGFDLDEKRMNAFTEMGGKAANNIAEIGAYADAVFIMVMNGDQAKAVILGDNGLLSSMAPNSAIILTATIKPSEAQAIAAAMQDSAIHLIDSPVSGGFPGAQNGTLTMMAAAPPHTLETFKPFMQAVSQTIHAVSAEAGDGQIMKACLQSLIGSIFSATFEAAALAAKAGMRGEALYQVVSTSSAGCSAANTALQNIIDRQFEGTGSHIATMHKDLTISLDMASTLEVPMHTASTAMQLFHAGKSKYPNGDNWIVTRVIEDIIGAELHR